VEIVEQLRGAFDTTGRIVAGIRPEQLSEPTPCKEWDVREVVDHATTVLTRFRSTALREPPPEGRPTGDADDDFVGAYLAAADSTLAAWTSQGALEGNCLMPSGAEWPAITAAGINATDTLVHGWDLAKATGQDATLDPALAAAILEFCRATVTDELRAGRGAFGPIVPVPDDASPTDRLVAFLGRQP
jgi:uncharacterized protein (TIGR03086 family)